MIGKKKGIKKKKATRRSKKINLKFSTNAIKQSQKLISIYRGLKIIFSVALVVCVCTISSTYIYKLFVSSNDQKLGKVVLKTNEGVDKRKVMKLIRLKKNTNLWSLNLEELRDRLEKEVEIEKVEIFRYFPDLLEINVVVRKPFVQLICNSLKIKNDEESVYFLDKKGVVWRSKHFLNYKSNLPKLFLENISYIKEGQKIKSESLISALESSHTILNLSSFRYLKLIEINVENNFFYDLIFLNNKSNNKNKMNSRLKITFGTKNIEAQISSLLNINKSIKGGLVNLKEINLSIGNKVVIKDKENKLSFRKSSEYATNNIYNNNLEKRENSLNGISGNDNNLRFGTSGKKNKKLRYTENEKRFSSNILNKKSKAIKIGEESNELIENFLKIN